MNKILWLLAIWQVLGYDVFGFDIVHLFYSQHYEKIAAIITSNFISL
jgi:hypothetical protein